MSASGAGTKVGNALSTAIRLQGRIASDADRREAERVGAQLLAMAEEREAENIPASISIPEEPATQDSPEEPGAATEALTATGYAADIPRDLALRAWNFSSHSPKRRGEDFLREYDETIAGLYQRAGDSPSAEVVEILDKQRAKIRAASLVYLNAVSRSASWNVTGRSGLNVRQYNKRNDTMTNKLRVLMDTIDNAKKNLDRVIDRVQQQSAIEEAGGEAELIQQELDAMIAQRDRMKLINKIARRKISEQDKIDQMIAAGVEPGTARSAAKSTRPFLAYQFTNLGGRIKTREKQIKQIRADEARAEARAEEGDPEEIPFSHNGLTGTVEIDTIDNRIRLHLTEKTSKKTLREKSWFGGWNFSRLNSAWQAKITDNALQATRQLTGLSLEKIPFMSDL